MLSLSKLKFVVNMLNESLLQRVMHIENKRKLARGRMKGEKNKERASYYRRLPHVFDFNLQIRFQSQGMILRQKNK